MNHISRWLLPVALLVLAGQAVAQAQGAIPIQVGELYYLPVQGVGAPVFTTSVAGHLQGYRLNDAVLLASGTPILVTAPGLHRSALPLPLPSLPPAGYVANDVRDIAILRGGGEEGRDALVMVTGTGLWTWHMTKVTVTPPGGSPGLQWAVSLNPLGTSVWAGAKRLRVADVNNDGIDDVLGIMSDELSIRCLQRDVVGATWVITANANVRDFVVADMVAGGAPEIVAAIGPVISPAFVGGLRVFAPGNSTALMQYRLPHDSGVCAPLRAATVTGVVFALSAGGVSSLRSYEAVNGGLVQRANLALTQEVGAITTGKWRTASEEVLLTFRTASNPVAVAQTGSLGLGDIRNIDIGSVAMTDNRAMCLLADWHGDPAESEVALRCVPRLIYPSTGEAKIVIQNTMNWDSRFVTAVGHNSRFGVAAPPDSRPTHVEITSWRLTLGVTGITMPSLTGRRELSLLTNSQTGWYVDPTEGYTSALAWMLSLRFVERNAAGVVVRRWPLRTAIVSFDGILLDVILAGFSGQVLIHHPWYMPGITGDVVQPPAGPDGDDDEPPKPPTGG